MNNNLQPWPQNPAISALFRGAPDALSPRPTGYIPLDTLIGGGWPRASLIDILLAQPGIGELSLLMPVLADLSRAGAWLAWIAPPYIPYAPALTAHGIELSRLLLVQARATEDSLWALEQALASGACGAVLAWPKSISYRQLRRLQLASATSGSLGFVFRPLAAAADASPAALRIAVTAEPGTLKVTVLKHRGQAGAGACGVPLPLHPRHAVAES